ncbi:MAG: indole-3-glycerol-phosphate synthase TrpC, partial [Syntrophus sp. (in: bacteria)]|nr:indole-3-glycerol-phosphate synthase TrpC [Syntrophus sp. (in: bacteria)]
MIRKIVETKKREVAALRGHVFSSRTRPVIPFKLKKGINIIAELKRKSPSAGDIGEIDDRRIAIYTQYATAMSILTDATYFNGSFELLAEVAGKTNTPILCKDFFIDESQIDLAWSKGADMILLIARILEEDRLKTLYDYAQHLGLNCLVEVHEAKELKNISHLNAHIVGVNARNLDTLTIDLDRAKEIMSLV